MLFPQNKRSERYRYPSFLLGVVPYYYRIIITGPIPANRSLHCAPICGAAAREIGVPGCCGVVGCVDAGIAAKAARLAG